jgi:hypothetical protein
LLEVVLQSSCARAVKALVLTTEYSNTGGVRKSASFIYSLLDTEVLVILHGICKWENKNVQKRENKNVQF